MKKFRIGTGFDVHRLAEGHKLIIGGVEIPHTKGCVGHSDADVLIHAICDAMLGALTLGDIGQHFPDNSDEFKGIDSRILLKKVNALISEEGYQIGNIDSTVVLQKPKIKDYIPKIREELASVLQVDVSQISVKVTTTEKLGFEGREEGVSAQAVCLLLRTLRL
jgi:2-C-methyl-D-erythritol 2,4-cyclodiphosphate synthase